MSRLLACAAAILALSQAAPPSKPTAEMQTDVDRLVARAGEMARLWPWAAANREIDRVARHGSGVAPLLVALLADDPDEPQMPEWRVQQHAALTLCRIYKVAEECGHVYCNRESREVNKAVKRFWLEKTSEETTSPQDKQATPSCRTTSSLIEDLIASKVRELDGTELCQFRLYNNRNDVDGDGKDDFLMVFSVEAIGRSANATQQFLVVFPSAGNWTSSLVQVGQRGVREVLRLDVEGRQVVLLTAERKEGDAMCCLSGSGKLTFAFDQGRLVAIPRVPD